METDREFLKREIDTLTPEQVQQVKAFIQALKIATPNTQQNYTQQNSTDARQILFDRFKATNVSPSEDISTDNSKE